jgi:hypothetical protein
MPFFRVLAIAQTLFLAHRHLTQLNARDRRRLRALVLRGPTLKKTERDELRRLLAKLEPRAFAFATADRFSPFPLPRRLAGAKK